jgi:hypothetical protein
MKLNIDKFMEICTNKKLTPRELICLILVHNNNSNYKKYLLESNEDLTYIYDLMRDGYLLEFNSLYDTELKTNNIKMRELLGDELVELELEFKSPTEKVNEFNNWVTQWNNKWKGIKSNYGLVKGDTRSVIDKMTKFIKTYKYTQEQIDLATDAYLEQQKNGNNYYYCMDSGNFILHRDKGSTLAKYCEQVKDGVKSTVTDYMEEI